MPALPDPRLQSHPRSHHVCVCVCRHVCRHVRMDVCCVCRPPQVQQPLKLRHAGTDEQNPPARTREEEIVTERVSESAWIACTCMWPEQRIGKAGRGQEGKERKISRRRAMAIVRASFPRLVGSFGLSAFISKTGPGSALVLPLSRLPGGTMTLLASRTYTCSRPRSLARIRGLAHPPRVHHVHMSQAGSA